MNKIRVGVLGCGRISQAHMTALKNQAQQYTVVAVADSFPGKAEELASQINATPYASLEEMLRHGELDLVVLCTPSGLHPAQAKACAEAGVPCLTEKPLGTFYQEAADVVDLFERLNVPLFVSYQTRYNPTIQKVRRWFEDGKLGKLNLIQGNVFWQRPQSYYDVAPWRGSRNLDGGAFMNQACHYVDLVQWFGGEVVSVKSEVATLGRTIECEDTGAAVIKFKSGAIGVLAVTMLAYPENQEGSILLLAEHATIKIGGKALNKLEICQAKDETIMQEMGEAHFDPATYGSGHGEYYAHLARHLKQSSHANMVSGRDGLNSLRIISKIYQEEGLPL